MTLSEFGSALRQQRERRGLSLAAIATTTKISAPLLQSLERGDVSRWPGGIYRRAFVRAYAAAIGLPPEPTLAEFVRLFPEPGQDPSTLLDDDDPRRLRLTLVAEPRWKAPALRTTTALVDAGVVALMALIAAKYTTFGFWMPAALAGLAYHAVAAILIGRSPGAWLTASSVGMRKPGEIRDQFAHLREGLVPDLLDSAKATREHPAAT